MALSDNIFFLIGLAFLGLGLLLHIIGLATPEWTVFADKQFADVTQGLWELCSSSYCVKVASGDAKLDAIRAFAIIAMLCGGAAGLLLIVNLFTAFSGKPANKLLALLSIAASSAALGSVVVSAAIWGSEAFVAHVTSPGYSFILCIVGGVFMMIGGLIGFVGFQRSGGLH